MAILTEEEKKKIVEEEEVRSQVRRKYEQKSSGTAAVLSTLCPGLGQIYNGQFGKGAAFFLAVLIGLCLLSVGVLFIIKRDSVKSMNIAKEMAVTEEEPVEMGPDGVVLEEKAKEEAQKAEGKKEKQPGARLPVKGIILTLVGAILMIEGGHQAVRDAIKTAKRLNSSPG